MKLSSQRRGRKAGIRVRIFALMLIAAIGLQLTPAQADAIGEQARKAAESAVEMVSKIKLPFFEKTVAPKPQSVESPSDRAFHVRKIRLCPRRLTLYVGEEYALVPLPLDFRKEPVHSALMTWDSRQPEVASVSSTGDVTAVAAGKTIVTVRAGAARASVLVEVLAGVRPVVRDDEYETKHGRDCDDPESEDAPEDRVQSTGDREQAGAVGGQLSVVSGEQAAGRSQKAASLPFKDRVAFASHRARSRDYDSNRDLNAAPASATTNTAAPFQIGEIDGDGSDTFSPAATNYNNAIGSPRFAAQLDSEASAIKTRKVLGSYNYVLGIPVLSLPGRGLGVNLALVYNSQLWTEDFGQMTFNYNKGWPAAGWSFGYGRLIENYDSTRTGNGSGSSQSNSPGNRLLIQPDGTRVHLQQSWDFVGQEWDFNSTDGTFLHLSMSNNRLKYPDGTVVKYQDTNNRLLPVWIRTRNGDKVTIAYKPYNSSTFKFRWAIDNINDSLGRVIQFNYDPSTGALVSVTAPDENGNPRQLVQIDYQTITLSYNFTGGLTVVAPSNNQLMVVRRIYQPQTGRGYLFSQYSSYGCARRISMNIGMTTSSDGTETAYTRYNYSTATAMYSGDPDVQTGALNDAPQYTQRKEWWSGKTDDSGNPTSAETVYNYSRQTDQIAQTETHTETDALHLTSIESKISTNTSDESSGKLTETLFKDSTGTVKRKTTSSYTAGPDGGVQLSAVESFDEENNRVKTETVYGNYGRVSEIKEYGYTTTVQRRTVFNYIDTQAYIDDRQLQLVDRVRVYDQSGTNVARTDYVYDDYGSMGGMESYNMPTNPFPPNHESGYDQSNTVRGNVTGVKVYSDIVGSVFVQRNTKYDIFGNAVEAQVSCCGVKTALFGTSSGSAMLYSAPLSTTDGRDGIAPFLKTSYVYNFYTSVVKQTTDANNQTTNFIYDIAIRLVQVNSPTGAVTVTDFDKDASGKDVLSYFQRVSYTDVDSTSKVITTRSWFDGGGRVLRSGVGQGVSPASYDAVKTVYDSLGRVLKQSNPYAGNSSGDGTPTFWTTNEYDSLWRVTRVTLPDGQMIQTAYNGDEVTVTDQVNRQRRSQIDGLGRLIAVTEQDVATGSLSVVTSYSYDALDNLVGVNQGGQPRSFGYDALSRLKNQTTPEGGLVTYSYWDFDAVKKRVDARNVETHYKYDSLNRLERVWYTGLGGDDTGAVRPALPAGVEATLDVVLQYNTASPGNGAVSRVDDGAGYETYAYDSLGRNTSKSRVIDGYTFTTSYEYNQVGQQTAIIYPSLKRVRTNYDARGRFTGLDKMNGSTLELSYLSQVGYNTAGQVTGLTLGNGVAESYGYSQDRLQMTSQTATKSGQTLMSIGYNYTASAGQSGAATTAGNSGQLMGVTAAINSPTANRNQAFTYDNVGRLKTAAGWNSTTNRRFDYDRWGNRVGVWNAVSGGTQIQSVTLQQPGGVTNNRISAVNTVSYVYDAVGDVTNDGAHSYQYDAESRMVKVDSGATAINTYDGANRRVKKQTSAGTTWYVWEGGRVIAEYGAAQGSGGTRYYHPDRLSTRMITNVSGAVAGTQDHLPFGEDAGVVGENEKHRFTNYERDSESGTDYAVNRQYSMNTGRFLQPDVIGGHRVNPQSLNRYAYSLNDPANLMDPLGLSPSDPICMVDKQEIPCGLAYSLLESGAADFLSITEGGVTYFLNRDSFYDEVVQEEREIPNPAVPGGVEILIVFKVTFNDTAYEVAAKAMLSRFSQASIQQMVNQMERDGMFDPPIAGMTVKGAKIATGILAKLIQKVGKGDAKKFEKAVEKGIVGPNNQSGIKILSRPEGKYTHELKIGGSAQRLLGYVDESGQIIFDFIKRGGLH